MDEERTGRRGEGNYEEDKEGVVIGVCNEMLANSFVGQTEAAVGSVC